MNKKLWYLLFQVKGLARDVYEKYFKAAQTQPRGVVAKLGNIVAQIERACQKQVRYISEVWNLVCEHNL